MIRGLLKLAFLLVVAILVYNRFFGTSEEKEQSKAVFQSVKGVVKSVGAIMVQEKEKYDAGKYDKVMDQLGGAYKSIREKAQFVDEKVLGQLEDLEKRKQKLEEDLEQLKTEDAQKAADPAPADKKTIGKNKPSSDESTSAAKAADRKAREEALRRELEKLVKETETLVEKATSEQ